MKALTAIYEILKADSNVNAVFSGRYYPLRVPTNAAFPCVQFQGISQTPVSQKSGAAKSDFTRVQINSYATSYAAAANNGELIRTALEAYSGTIGGVTVQYIEYVNGFDQVDDNAGYEGIYTRVMEFMVDCNG